MQLHALQWSHLDEVLDVLTDAFRDYPVMRHTLGAESRDPVALRTLIRLFAGRRLLAGDPVLGVRDGAGTLVAVATTTTPVELAARREVEQLRDETWSRLGPAAQQRYVAFAETTRRFTPPAPHHDLNMIGVRREVQGCGHARRLLEAVHALAASDAASTGVALTTEREGNLALYRRFGYRVIGSARVADALDTWTLFRPREAA